MGRRVALLLGLNGLLQFLEFGVVGGIHGQEGLRWDSWLPLVLFYFP